MNDGRRDPEISRMQPCKHLTRRLDQPPRLRHANDRGRARDLQSVVTRNRTTRQFVDQQQPRTGMGEGQPDTRRLALVQIRQRRLCRGRPAYGQPAVDDSLGNGVLFREAPPADQLLMHLFRDADHPDQGLEPAPPLGPETNGRPGTRRSPTQVARPWPPAHRQLPSRPSTHPGDHGSSPRPLRAAPCATLVWDCSSSR